MVIRGNYLSIHVCTQPGRTRTKQLKAQSVIPPLQAPIYQEPSFLSWHRHAPPRLPKEEVEIFAPSILCLTEQAVTCTLHENDVEPEKGALYRLVPSLKPLPSGLLGCIYLLVHRQTSTPTSVPVCLFLSTYTFTRMFVPTLHTAPTLRQSSSRPLRACWSSDRAFRLPKLPWSTALGPFADMCTQISISYIYTPQI